MYLLISLWTKTAANVETIFFGVAIVEILTNFSKVLFPVCNLLNQTDWICLCVSVFKYTNHESMKVHACVYIYIYIYIYITPVTNSNSVCNRWVSSIWYNIWYVVIWYYMWNDMIYGMIWYDMIWHDVTWRDVTWRDMTWHDMIWYMVWHGMIWYDIIYHIIIPYHIYHTVIAIEYWDHTCRFTALCYSLLS